jgi:hypothetical protein
MNIYTKEDIDNIQYKIDKGEKISRYENIFYNKNFFTRKSGLKYYLNNEELQEYIKCYNDIFYFAEKYCQIKRADGSIGIMKLRDYQIEILKSLINNKKVINMSSHQMGITLVHSIYYLYKMIFTENFNILYISNKTMTSVEVIEKIKHIYFNLPFFIKKGIDTLNKNSIKFESGSSISIKDDNETKYNIISLNEFSRIYNNEELYNKYKDNDCIFIISQPNGHNFFYTLVQDSYCLKNDFVVTKTYWWQIPSRDEKWRLEEIRKLGSEFLFNQEYDLYFFRKL